MQTPNEPEEIIAGGSLNLSSATEKLVALTESPCMTAWGVSKAVFSLTRLSRVAAIAQADVITTEPVGSGLTLNGYTDAWA